VAVLGRLVVDGVRKVKLLDNDTGPQVKVVLDNLHKLIRVLVRGPVGLNEERERLRNTNGVRQLDKGATGELGSDERLGNPASEVGGGTVDLGVVLSGEGTTTVGSPATVRVDDDLAASKTGVALGTTDDEEARGLDVVDGLVVKVLGRDDLLDDLLKDLLSELLGGNVLAVLGGHDNGVDANGDNGTAVVSVLDGDLRLGVGAQPGQRAVVASLLHGGVELVREQQSQGEQFWGLVRGIAEHDALVTGTELLHGLLIVQTLGNVGRLLLNGDENVARLVVEALVGAVVANVLDGVADDLLVVEMGLGGDLAKDHDHARLGGSLAGNLGERVLLEAGIEDGV
jgi:hypothetical protein